jgi:hypothetical protein
MNLEGTTVIVTTPGGNILHRRFLADGKTTGIGVRSRHGDHLMAQALESVLSDLREAPSTSDIEVAEGLNVTLGAE